ncbi:molybdenum cofactor biosynthetic protein [Niveomyces insectorum RCEF 264]|uniref:Adenylyltransferase and sulfurtransferase uba4 n=1 Tax=Niveomyces insectorum RCEF 264 TaxID=1081102 RepID=A0A162I965_9HYPO|nr:molybdenum cofactor biosynthetic protein [Niveomyces insectorum RCEF 264]
MSGLTTNDLRRRIACAEVELQNLRILLTQAEAGEREKQLNEEQHAHGDEKLTQNDSAWKWPLRVEEYERYARQLILPGVGVQGQLRLKAASVLIVGAGGLGCPAAAYLAGAGVGHIGVVDGDVVEASNLHRQISHTTDRVGHFKAESLVVFMRQLNPLPRYSAHTELLVPGNATALIGNYDLILDCTDHPSVRYLVSDACVRAGKPLVSAAALRTDGQLAVLNWPIGKGPCYRCVFPRPPPPLSQMSCAEGGVLGPAVGVMGVLQALEAIRIIVAGVQANTNEDAHDDFAPQAPTLLLFSAGGAALKPPSFRSVRLRGRRPDCFACAVNAPLRRMWSAEDTGSSNKNVVAGGETGVAWPDYVQFCGGDFDRNISELQPDERISATELKRLLQEEYSRKSEGTTATDTPRLWLLDVREKELFDMGAINGAVNIPFSRIQRCQKKTQSKELDALPDWLPEGMRTDMAPIYLVCRIGNDSQVVTRQLKELGLDKEGKRFIGDVKGGIRAWKSDIDSTIPFL